MCTKAEFRTGLSQNGKRTLMTVSEICESVGMSENVVRPLIKNLRPFKLKKDSRKTWYSVDDVTDVIWGCRR